MPHSAIRLAESDNVAMVTSDVKPGAEIEAGGRRIAVRDSIPFGHKIALSPIQAGDAVVKFGVLIGRAKAAIQPGEHVHVHNIESVYINNATDYYDA
jgi:altronate dehydratase